MGQSETSKSYSIIIIMFSFNPSDKTSGALTFQWPIIRRINQQVIDTLSI